MASSPLTIRRAGRRDAGRLARLVAERPGSMVFTQNVDGFHRDVGTANLVEIHGNLHQLLCTECGRGRRVPDYAGLIASSH